MALKRKKLDAICAHLKKTSAVDVNAITQNGVSGNSGFVFGADAGATAKSTAKPASTTNNNNEETATDLNENPDPQTISDPSLLNDSAQSATTGEPGISSQDSKSSPEPSFSFASTQGPSSGGFVNSAADASILDSEPASHVSVPSSQVSASSTQPTGSGRRKSRKAAKPRLVFQAAEQYDNDDEENQEIQSLENRDLAAESSDPLLVLKNRNGLDSLEKHPDKSFKEPVLSSSSGFANQYSLPEQQQQQQEQHNESIGQFTDPSPIDSPSSTLASVPLDLSTSKTSVNSESQSADVSYLDNEDEEEDAGDSSTCPSTAASSPGPAAPVAPMVVSAEAEGLADYAANTMNELLSIYGFGAVGLDGGGGKQVAHTQQDLSTLHALAAAGSGKVLSAPPAHQGNGGGGIVAGVRTKQPHHSEALQKALLSPSILSVGEGLGSSSSNPGQSSGGGVRSGSKGSSGPQLTKFKFHNVKPSIKQSPGSSSNGGGSSMPKVSSSDYNKYIKKFHSGADCGGSHCRDLGYRDHYHCHDCNFKVLVKKEEMVRHYKWHKKRDESLQHGFLRYSPLDDCSIKYGSCTHNKRQTHYHCIQSGCDKVYISTSDVQMHANYHRKDSAIIQEGFQRFRATEDCGTTTCGFYGQRTTHFHCRRSNCNFTFKHKADMEKHKSYHQKDEILGRDGFKKFMKYEHCSYSGCRFSKISNHIHCIRPGCNYVLHSTAQLYSHKRKHERREFENLYRTFRQAQRPQIQPSSTNAVHSRPRPQAPNVASLPTNAIPLVSKVNLTSIPLQGYGEPMLAGTVVAGQILQPMPVPIKVEARQGTVLAPNVSLVSAGAQTTSIIKNSFITVAQPSTPTTLSASHNTNGNSTHKTEAIQAVTHLPEPSKDQPPESASNHVPKPETVRIKQEPKSDAESDSESQPVDQKAMTSTLPFSPVASGLAEVKEEGLNKSLNLSIPANQAGKVDHLEVPKPAGVVKSMSDASIGVDTSNLANHIVTLRPPMKKVGAPEKRERDESWKNYLIRYTANDPCHSRCQLLYKDHYHCKIAGCQVLFRSKDGVREHAKFHDLQERITPMVYVKYESTQACLDHNCQYNQKQSHFHCNWTNCKHVIPEFGQTFARLEHYRIHEYAKVSAGKNYRTQSGPGGSSRAEDLAHRRRGRPPKYPRLDVPLVPKVDLTEQEIQESVMKAGEGEEIRGDEKIINGFRKYDGNNLCPDDRCMYHSGVHYHCGRPRCHTSTDRIDVLNLHAKDFHSFVIILDNFEFFDRNVNCRRGHCSNNCINRHFHCTYPRCDYSFVRHSTMAQHQKKHHPDTTTSKALKPLTPTTTPSVSSPSTPLSPGARITPIQLLRRPDGQTYIPIVPAPTAVDKSVVKAAGTFYPLSSLPTGMSGTPVSVVTSHGQALTSTTLTLTIPANLVSSGIPVMSSMTSGTVVSTTSNIVPIIAGNLVAGTVGTAVSTAPPLTVLLQQKPSNDLPQPSWSTMRSSMHYSLQASCGRPFCKLKKKDHYHCLECNQAFSDPARLRGHISKHGVKFKKITQAHSNASIASALPFNKPQTSEQGSAEMGLDLSTSKLKEDKIVKAEGLDADENDNDAEDDNDSLSSSLNLSMGKITNCLTQQNNTTVDLSENNSETQLVIDEQASHSEEDGVVANASLNGNEDEDENASDMSFPTNASITSSPTTSRRSGRKRTAPNHSDFVSSDDANLMAKQMKLKLSAPIPSTIPATPVASNIPKGFIRIKCGTDCGYTSCNYRHSVSHFHCLRPECGYGFSDKSRIENHLERHGRLDNLMGDEFCHFRATVACGRGDCEFSKKSSHFHCQNCTFVCADSSKVLAHRKYHAKMDNISKNGFHKYGALEACGVLMCSYSRKHTHYHCTHEGCNHAVLGPAQMAPHKLKHASHDV